MLVRPGARACAARVVCLLGLIAAIACATPPQKEMDQAEGALTAARAAGAAQYAAEEFTAAEAALRRSHDAVSQRDYRQALNHALDARERAQTAAREAADKKAIARGRAERAITAAELALAPAQQRLQAPRGDAASRRVLTATAVAVKALQLAASTADSRLQEARAKMQVQEFAAALVAAEPVPEQIRVAIAAYDEARAAATAGRGSRRSR
jgi:hypothetical protein